MQTRAGIEMQVETDNYRPRQLFYHHTSHKLCASKVSIMDASLATASRTTRLLCPHGLLDAVLPSEVSLTFWRRNYFFKF